MSAPVLLLHGQPGSAADWQRVLAALAHRRAIAFDRPGWDGVRPATDLEGNAGAALAELDVHGIDRAVVVGHSFGGAVGAWLAAHHPERVHSLVLAAPAANVASLSAVDRVLAAPLAGEVLSSALLGAAGWSLSIGVVRRLIGGDERHIHMVARQLRSPATWRAFVAEQRTLISDLPRLEPELSRISARTRIVAGGRDFVIPISSLRQLQSAIPGAELETIAGADHLLPFKRPGAVLDAISAMS